MAHDTHLAGAVDAHEGLAGLRRAHESAVRSAEMDVLTASLELRSVTEFETAAWWDAYRRHGDAVDRLVVATQEAAAAGVIL